MTVESVRITLHERRHRLSQVELAYPHLAVAIGESVFDWLIGELMSLPMVDFPADPIGTRKLIEAKMAESA